jgi:glutaredoxin 3
MRNAKFMPDVRMYSTRICPYCIRAERLLNKKGVQVQKILVDLQPEEREKMIKITGRRTVPQIFIGEMHVGGYDDLVDLDLEGELDPLLRP